MGKAHTHTRLAHYLSRMSSPTPAIQNDHLPNVLDERGSPGLMPSTMINYEMHQLSVILITVSTNHCITQSQHFIYNNNKNKHHNYNKYLSLYFLLYQYDDNGIEQFGGITGHNCHVSVFGVDVHESTLISATFYMPLTNNNYTATPLLPSAVTSSK